MPSAVTKKSGNSKQYYQARILFDTGSQRNFITQEMKHKLKLETMGSELLDVTTFGTLQGRRKTYDLVALTLSTEVENIKITALVTPVICRPLSAKVKNLQIPPELQGLKLADPSHASENLKVDIIIGNDYYGQLITGKVFKTQNEAYGKQIWMASLRSHLQREERSKQFNHPMSKGRNHASRRRKA